MPNPFAHTTLLLAAALLARTAPLAAQEKTQQPLNIESFEAVKAVSDPQMAPSGSTVLFSVRTTNLASNSRSSMTYKVAASGGAPAAFPDASTSVGEARWSPDGKRVAYIAGDQLWVADQMGARASSSRRSQEARLARCGRRAASGSRSRRAYSRRARMTRARSSA